MTNLYESTQVTTEEAVELVPMKRAGEPLEVVQAIVFLLGPDSSYITVSNVDILIFREVVEN